MNYLAHIHLGHLSQTSLVGNFLGDFVKGSDLSHLNKGIRQGVWLHRRIDSYTDQHLSIVKLRQQFPKNLRRFSGITLDVYFDHLLCLHWRRFSHQPITTVLDEFYRQLEKTHMTESQRFSEVKERLLKYQWLASYSDRKSIEGTLTSIEKRFSRPIKFSDSASAFLNDNHSLIEDHFLTFYPQLIKYSNSIKGNYVG